MTPTAALCDYVLPATSFLEMSNITTAFEHRQLGKTHLQYRAAVVEPLHERRSDTWILFELAKRMGMSEQFLATATSKPPTPTSWQPTGITLEQLKNAPGGISRPVAPSFEKHAKTKKTARPRGFATPSKRVELYCHKFAAAGYPALAGIRRTGVEPGQPSRHRRRFSAGPDQREKSPPSSTANIAP